MPNPFAHVELQSGDIAESKKFYKALFSWKLKDIPDMSYTMIDVGTGTGGGMMTKMMPEAPTAWLPYVQVDSVKKSVEKAKSLGANTIVEYQPIGDMGAIGIIADPGGAVIGLWEMGKAARAAAKKAAPAKKAPKKAAKKAAPAKKAPKKAAKPAKKAAKKKK